MSQKEGVNHEQKGKRAVEDLEGIHSGEIKTQYRAYW